MLPTLSTELAYLHVFNSIEFGLSCRLATSPQFVLFYKIHLAVVRATAEGRKSNADFLLQDKAPKIAMAGGTAGTAIAGTHEIVYGPPGYKGLIKEPRLFALACFASIGGLLFGYDQGVISGVLVMNNFVGSTTQPYNRCQCTNTTLSGLGETFPCPNRGCRSPRMAGLNNDTRRYVRCLCERTDFRPIITQMVDPVRKYHLLGRFGHPMCGRKCRNVVCWTPCVWLRSRYAGDGCSALPVRAGAS